MTRESLTPLLGAIARCERFASEYRPAAMSMLEAARSDGAIQAAYQSIQAAYQAIQLADDVETLIEAAKKYVEEHGQ